MCHTFNVAVGARQVGARTCVIGWRLSRFVRPNIFYGACMGTPLQAVPVGPAYLIGEPEPTRKHGVKVVVETAYRNIECQATSLGGLYAYHQLPPQLEWKPDLSLWVAASPLSWVRFASSDAFSALALFIGQNIEHVLEGIRLYKLNPQEYWGFRWTLSHKDRGYEIEDAKWNVLSRLNLPDDLCKLVCSAPADIHGDGPYQACLTSNFFRVML